MESSNWHSSKRAFIGTDGLKQTVIRPGQISDQEGTLVSLGTQVSLASK